MRQIKKTKRVWAELSILWEGHWSIRFWKTQEWIAMSSCDAEYIALASGCTEIMFQKMLLGEITYYEVLGILLEDYIGAILLMQNQQVSHRTTKHIYIWWHFICKLVRDEGNIEGQFVWSEDNKADCGMKIIPPKLLVKFRSNIWHGQLYARHYWKIIIKEGQQRVGW